MLSTRPPTNLIYMFPHQIRRLTRQPTNISKSRHITRLIVQNVRQGHRHSQRLFINRAPSLQRRPRNKSNSPTYTRARALRQLHSRPTSHHSRHTMIHRQFTRARRRSVKRTNHITRGAKSHITNDRPSLFRSLDRARITLRSTLAHHTRQAYRATTHLQ